MFTDSQTNVTSLKLSWATKANLSQRAGRAGRVMDGKVYRMIYKEDFDVSLSLICEKLLLIMLGN